MKLNKIKKKQEKNLFVASLLIIIGAGIYRTCLGRVENFSEPFVGSTYSGVPSALYAGLFSYAGW